MQDLLRHVVCLVENITLGLGFGFRFWFSGYEHIQIVRLFTNFSLVISVIDSVRMIILGTDNNR